MMMLNLRELDRRYRAALHAMQTGVLAMMGREPDGETAPKHLRVGVNSAMCDNAALVGLLVEKGLITREEHALAICVEMEREVARYEARVGAQVTLR
jgi:hypothetical protein